MGEFDRVLGGGITLGGSILLAGGRGIGKSTLLMQAVDGTAQQGHRVLYVSGEESIEQVSDRARRVGAQSFDICQSVDIDEVETHLSSLPKDERPSVVIFDSVQKMMTSSASGLAGSTAQVRAVTDRITAMSQKYRVASFLIGHMTKDGEIAGPTALQHYVDVVLSFEGDPASDLRILRCLGKNRFGTDTELGFFCMTSGGLQEVPNPSERFLAHRPRGEPGSIVAPTVDGTRSMLIEVQGLVHGSRYDTGRVTAVGVDGDRLRLITAVLGMSDVEIPKTSDIFLNIPSGVVAKEPALDLAIALVLASSVRSSVLDPDMVAIGEIGCTGELRAVSRMDLRLREAARMGFTRAVVPLGTEPMDGIRLIEVEKVIEALDELTEKKPHLSVVK